MATAHAAIALITIAANTFSGIASMTRFPPIMRRLTPAMQKTGISQSWLVFPIGTLKLVGGLGVLLGLLGAPLVGTAAAIGLILFFVCAAFAHVRVSDYSPTFFLAVGFFLPLAATTLALDIARL